MKSIRNYLGDYPLFTVISMLGTFLLYTSSICLAQDSLWTAKSSIPSPRWFLSATVLDGKIYAMGGVNNPSKVEEFNPITDSWTTKANMLTARATFGTCAVGGKIYVFGGSINVEAGQPGIDVTEEYDPSTNTWKLKKNMPKKTYGVCACVVNDKIYVIGGDPPKNRNDMYDPLTDEWESKSPMQTARFAPTCVVVDNKIFAFGGYKMGDYLTDVVEMYDPVTDSWAKKTEMPLVRGAHAAAFAGGQIHIFGGLSVAGGRAFSNHWIYDPFNDTWDSSLPNMPYDWSHMGYAVVNERIYLIAGSEVRWPHDDNLTRVMEYTPKTDLSNVIEDNLLIMPDEFTLEQNYPNPFNPSTTIKYSIPKQSNVTLKVYDLLGSEVAILINKKQSQGSYEVEFDGSELSSGIYFYRLQVYPANGGAGEFVETKKMILLK